MREEEDKMDDEVHVYRGIKYIYEGEGEDKSGFYICNKQRRRELKKKEVYNIMNGRSAVFSVGIIAGMLMAYGIKGLVSIPNWLANKNQPKESTLVQKAKTVVDSGDFDKNGFLDSRIFNDDGTSITLYAHHGSEGIFMNRFPEKPQVERSYNPGR
jgi:hypothetical protein